MQPTDPGRSKSFVPPAFSSTQSVPDKHRVAVLPLQNMSPDSKDEYFADGLTEELISAISNVSGLSVISRTSVMQFKKPGKKLAEIGGDLRVGTILEGSVRKSGNKVRVSVQLIDVKEDKNLWAQNYDRELEDTFAIQSDIAERVAKTLEVKVFGEEKHRLEGRTSKNVEALTLYMKGKSFYMDEKNFQNEAGILRAIEYFEQAIQQDSNFALAYVGLADCYYFTAILLHNPTFPNRSEYLAKAKQNLDKALTLNPDLGEAHASLGNWLRFESRWDEGEVEFRKAIALSPSYALAHSRFVYLLCAVGKLDEALYEARQAEELDPLSTEGPYGVGMVLYYQREYDRAIEQWKQVLRIEPNFPFALSFLAITYTAKSMMEEALRWRTKWKEQVGDLPRFPGWAKALLACAYVRVGRVEEAKGMFRGAEAQGLSPDTSPVIYAYWHMCLGNIDLAFEFLEKACEAKDMSLFDIKVDPWWDSLRSDPRFAILLQRLRLA